MNPIRTNNLWPWFPLLVLGGTAIPSLIIVLLAHHMRLGLVEDLPYQASVHYDADKQARRDFAEAGYHFSALGDGPRRLRFRLTAPPGGTAPLRAQVALYRPDDARCDRTITWDDPSHDLQVTVPHPGLWRVRVDATAYGREDHRPIAVETSVDAPPEDTP